MSIDTKNITVYACGFGNLTGDTGVIIAENEHSDGNSINHVDKYQI